MFNGFEILLVVLGGSTLEMERAGVLRSRHGCITQDSFRVSTRQREIRKTGSDKMAEV